MIDGLDRLELNGDLPEPNNDWGLNTGKGIAQSSLSMHVVVSWLNLLPSLPEQYNKTGGGVFAVCFNRVVQFSKKKLICLMFFKKIILAISQKRNAVSSNRY